MHTDARGWCLNICVHLRSSVVSFLRPSGNDRLTGGMSTSAKSVRFDEQTLWVELTDGRVLGVPLAWFPRLLRASPAERSACRISPTGQGLHWEALDEDISVAGLLAGRGDVTVGRQAVA